MQRQCNAVVNSDAPRPPLPSAAGEVTQCNVDAPRPSPPQQVSVFGGDSEEAESTLDEFRALAAEADGSLPHLAPHLSPHLGPHLGPHEQPSGRPSGQPSVQPQAAESEVAWQAENLPENLPPTAANVSGGPPAAAGKGGGLLGGGVKRSNSFGRALKKVTTRNGRR